MRLPTLLTSLAAAASAAAVAGAHNHQHHHGHNHAHDHRHGGQNRTQVVVVNGGPDLLQTAFATPQLSRLAGLIALADLDEALSGDDEITVFAPTNDAFAAVPDDALAALIDPDNRDDLAGLLTYHAVPGRLFSRDIPDGRTELETLAGETLVVEKDGDGLRVNGTPVQTPDIYAANGVVHVIGGVLSPDDVPEARTAAHGGTPSVLGLLRDADTLSTLRAAVDAAGFSRSLDERGPYTVLAPTDEAFAGLPDGTLDTLLERRNVERLRAVLRLHVVGAEASAQEAVAAGEVESREGSTLSFEIEDGQLFVQGPANRVRVVRTDITADNGVVHVVDGVLLPGGSH